MIWKIAKRADPVDIFGVVVAAVIGWILFGAWGGIGGGALVVLVYVVLEVQYMQTRDKVEEIEKRIEDES